MGFAEYHLLIAYTQESVKSIPPHERRQLLLSHVLCSHKHPHRWEPSNTAHRLFNSSTRGKSSLNATSHLFFSFYDLSYCPLSITVICPPIHFHCNPMFRKHSLFPPSSASSTVASTPPAYDSTLERIGHRCTAEDYQPTAEKNG
jgi:hypothetical protein